MSRFVRLGFGTIPRENHPGAGTRLEPGAENRYRGWTRNRKNEESPVSEMQIKEIPAAPEFDMFFYCEVAGENRIDRDLLEEIEERWERWAGLLKAHLLTNPEGGAQYVFLFMDKAVEDEIEGIWQDSPTHGLALHNLAIAMVMSAAHGLIPELQEGRCAPLPKPGKAMLDAFDKLGLTWNKEGTVNRQYAVLTPYPYSGGCDICYLQPTCPKAALER